MSTPSDSLRCRHCQADNPAGSSRCWLCDAADWNPAVFGTPRGQIKGTALPGAARGFQVDMNAVMLVLILTSVLIWGGIAGQRLGLAIVVGTIWWLSLGFTVFRHRGLQPDDVFTSMIGAVVLAVVLLGLLVVAVIVFLFVVCVRPGFR